MSLDFANWPVGPLPIIVALLSLKRLFDISIRGEFRSVSHDASNFLAYVGVGASMAVIALWALDQIWPGAEQQITYLRLYTLSLFTSAGCSLIVHFLVDRFCGTSPFLGQPITREIAETADPQRFTTAAFILVMFLFGFGFFFGLLDPTEISRDSSGGSFSNLLLGSAHHNYGIAAVSGSLGGMAHIVVVSGLRMKRIMNFKNKLR